MHSDSDRISQAPPLRPTEALPRDGPETKKDATRPWVHFAAGAAGGLATATATSPLDVLRTRLQTDFYQAHPSAKLLSASPSHFSASLQHMRDTIHLLYSIPRSEGWRGLFRGLGPSLTGVVPANAVKFYTYGNAKRIACEITGWNSDAVAVHAMSASSAGIVTGLMTNPIWLVKTRLQLDKSRHGKTGGQYKNSLDCAMQVLRHEGIRGLYRGLSASFLGAAETTLHLVLYEQMKLLFPRPDRATDPRQPGGAPEKGENWVGVTVAAAASKFLAAIVAYPHEVIRTRLRQAPMENGHRRYTGLVQCFRATWQEGRFVTLYGGLTAHVMRAVPSAVITLGVYELTVRFLSKAT